MKTFDIETFEKNKNEMDRYLFITGDSTVFEQSDDGHEFYETIRHKNSYFQIINRYYTNGKIKSTGEYYINSFQKGIWKEYDEDGNLIKETDYEAPFTCSWEQILIFIKQRELDMDAYGFQVIRGSSDKGTSWSITYNKSEEDMLLGVIIIDGITGKVIDEFDEPYPLEE